MPCRVLSDADHRAAVVEKLLPLLDDPVGVRRRASICLKSWVDASSESALKARLAAGSNEVRRELMPMFTSFNTASAADTLARHLAVEDARNRTRPAVVNSSRVLFSRSSFLDQDGLLHRQRTNTAGSSKPTVGRTQSAQASLGAQLEQITLAIVRSEMRHSGRLKLSTFAASCRDPHAGYLIARQ
jgi:hypothetical protein